MIRWLQYFVQAGAFMVGITFLAILWVAMVSFSAFFAVVEAVNVTVMLLFIFTPAVGYATARAVGHRGR